MKLVCKTVHLHLTYLVGFVVVLGIVFEDFRLLRIFEVTNKVIEIELFPPVLAIDKPLKQISVIKAPERYMILWTRN